MTTLLSRYGTLALAGALSALMWVTRGNHFISPAHLPDASWAIFFLLGVYFRQRVMLPLFLAQAAIIDWVAITQFGASDFCVTPAYIFLVPAYSALWLAGRWSARHLEMAARSLPAFAAAAFASTLACELISSGSFYFLGGRFAETSVREFAARLVEFFPGNLGAVALYLGCAALVHLVLAASHRGHAAHPAP
jgi:hypothetical protein